MTTDPVAVEEWPGLFVRVLSALEVEQLMEMPPAGDVRGAIRIAHLCTVDDSGARVWPTEQDAADGEWPQVKAAALAAFGINGLLKGDAAGN